MSSSRGRRGFDGTHIHYGWVVAVAAIVLSFFAQAATSPSGQYVASITAELGFSRGAYMVTSSVNAIVHVLFSLVYGTISKKISAKKLIALAMGLLASTLIINSFAQDLWVFYLTSAMLGTALAIGVSVTMAIIIRNWFAYKQGTLIGILLAAGSAGGAIFTQVAVRIAGTYGWRVSYRCSAALLIFIALPCLLLIKEKPEDKGLEPYGIEHIRGVNIQKGSGIASDGLGFLEAMKMPRFWLGAAGFFLLGSCAHPILGNLPAYVTDSGFNPTYAGLASGLCLISAAAYKLILGGVYDRFGIAPVIVTCFAGSAVSSLLFAGALSEVTIIAVPLIFGASLCGVTMVPLLYVATAFGQKEYASFSGIFMALIPAGSAIGNPVLGAVYDRFGSYRPALFVMAGLATIALFFVLVSLKGRRFVQPAKAH